MYCTRCFFFFIDTATTEIYTYGHTLSLHDALPIFRPVNLRVVIAAFAQRCASCRVLLFPALRRRVPQPSVNIRNRSEEHTSELQSLMRISYAVFCLKKKKH